MATTFNSAILAQVLAGAMIYPTRMLAENCLNQELIWMTDRNWSGGWVKTMHGAHRRC